MRCLSCLLLVVVVAACGDSSKAKPDANNAPADARPDSSNADAPPDSPAQVTDGIAGALAAADGTGMSLPIHHVTVTYIKPQLGSMTNDPAGFTIQAQKDGPGLFVTVDPATLSPVPVVGDVVDFTITQMGTVHTERRAQAVDSFTRVSQGADVSALATDVSSVTDLVTNLAMYDARVVNVTGTFAAAPASSGTGFQALTLNTAGVTDPMLQLRAPATIVDANDFAATCQISAHAVPVGRFDATAEIGVYATSDFTLGSCPAPAVVSATALSATAMRVTFSRNLDSTSVMTDASQFTATGLTFSNPVVAGRTVTLTTTAQTPNSDYDVVVANTVKDLLGSALATSLDAHMLGFVTLAGVRINELNANIASNCDLIELRVISDGSMAGFKITERTGSTSNNEMSFTFPAGFNVHKNDFVVVHTASASTTCNPGGATAETTAPNDQPTATYGRNFDTAFDFYSTDNGITNTDNVITLFDSTGTIVDALLVSKDPAGTSAAAGSLNGATAVLTASQWMPAAASYDGTAFCTNAADDLDATATTVSGNSIQRINDSDTNAKADWTTGAGATSTWGALNAGQSALP
jgi:Bacterial Ig-like domain